MLSLSSVFTRSNPLCNSAFGHGIKEKYSDKYFSIMVNSIVNKPIFYNKRNNIKATQLSNKDIFIKKIHIKSSLHCLSFVNDDKLSKSLNVRKSSSNIKDLFGQSDDVVKNDDVNIDKNDKNQSIPVRKSSYQHQPKKEKYNIKEIEKMYLNPKAKIHEIYQHVKNDLKKNSLNIEFKQVTGATNKNIKSQLGWICNVNVSWPEELSFNAYANNKNSAGYQACLKCLHWLENQKKIIKGLPVLYDTGGISNLLNIPLQLSVKPHILYEVKLIVDKYDENIKSLIEGSQNIVERFKHNNFQNGAVIDPVGKSNPVARFPERIKDRNQMLQLRYENRIINNNYANLPILNFKEQIIKAVKDNQVLLINGDTGCGKTTQVPQYIMDSFAKNGSATECNIIVSQPRRISAISLAERVAEERKEQVGDVVGFQVRLDQNLPNTPAGILFCTTGILLRKLQFNPTLEGCSHVIIDEAHERTINTDMLLVLLKRIIENNSNLKIIIMSATISAELFQNYFNCNVIEIPGRTFPVEMNFLDDIDKFGLRAPSRWDLSFQDSEKINSGPTVDIVKMGELISWIIRNKPPGAILCFLPGWTEIMLMKRYLEQFTLIPKNKMFIVPVHSKIAPYEQKKIFQVPPSDMRKIVLATDIAETGITVTDVVYVVDSCIHKQLRFQEKRGISSIDNYWVSKANIQQRKGRAGRVKPGISYHFINKNKFDHLEPYPIPEIKCSSLEKTVLDIKTYSDEKAIKFLLSMPQPPATNVISQALDHLINLGALDNEENLTALGRRIAFFTVHPKLSKAMVYSAIFQCVSPIVTIASVVSSDNQVFTDVLNNKEAMRNIKKKYHPTSDHISMAWLFQQWNICHNQSKEEARNFCLKNHLYPERVYTLSRVRSLNAEHLISTRIMSNKQIIIDDMEAKENEYAELDELVKGVLLSGLDSVLYHRDFDFRKGMIKKATSTLIMEDGNRATLTPDSVNFKRENWPSHYLTYVRRTHSEERRTTLIRESSIISPLTVFLFCQAQMLGYLKNNNNKNNNNTNTNNNNDNDQQSILFIAKDRKNINLICDKDTADILINFRDAMWSVVRYMIENYGAVESKDIEVFDQINAYRIEMIQVLAKMLSEAAQAIDRPDIEDKLIYDESNKTNKE